MSNFTQKAAIIFTLICICIGNIQAKDFILWDKSLPTKKSLPSSLIPEGAFSGVSNQHLIIAGGLAQDRTPTTLVRIVNLTTSEIVAEGNLPEPLAHGGSVMAQGSLLCIGGENRSGARNTFYKISWENKKITVENLNPLPVAVSRAAGVLDHDMLYVVAGKIDEKSDSKKIKNYFWRLNLAASPKTRTWDTLPLWKGEAKYAPSIGMQYDGYENGIYIFGGFKLDLSGKDEESITPFVFSEETYEFMPSKHDLESEGSCWRSRAPLALEARPGRTYVFPLGQSHFAFFLHGKSSYIMNLYHTITDTWVAKEAFEHKNLFYDNKLFYMISPDEGDSSILQVKTGKLLDNKKTFGVVNFLVIVLYAAAMIGIGVFFKSRNKNTNDYFRGGQRVPPIVAGLSIYATMLSSITFVAIPARVYALNWLYFPGSVFGLLIVVPLIMYFVVPHYCKLNAASAYEFLEKRFNVYLRIFAAICFILFQIGRMAVVMFLPALALAVITPLSVTECILLMGLVSVTYCTMGGLEAVVWTDAVQSLILLAGAFLTLILIIVNVGGISEFYSVAEAGNKFYMLDFDFSLGSYAKYAFWVVLVGSIGANLTPYASDQAIVQRYMAVKDLKSARSSLKTSIVIGLLSAVLFHAIGTALYVFFKNNPAELDPMSMVDAVFPLYIANNLPIGMAGLVVAGIFAAAQSTVSTSVNSIATVVVTDFIDRFKLIRSESKQLWAAKIITAVVGIMGTLLALVFAKTDVKSLWDASSVILGLFASPMCGLFLLGMFCKRVSSSAATIGAVLGFAALIYIKFNTNVHFLLYTTISIIITMFLGWLVSFVPYLKNSKLPQLTEKNFEHTTEEGN